MPCYHSSDNCDLWYEEQGAGPALMFLHGWCMSSFVWQLQRESFTSRFRVITADFRGHGKSEPGDGCLAFDRLADDIIVLMQQLDLQQLILVGWSMGAEVALAIAARVPERLSGLVLVSGTPCFTASDDFPHGLNRSESAGLDLMFRRNLTKARERFTKRMFMPDDLDQHENGRVIGEILKSVPCPDITVISNSLRELAEGDLRALLPGIGTATLIVNGDSDTICLPQASDFMASQLVNSRHVTIKDCGHAPFLTHHKYFDELICNFYRRLFGQDC